MVCYAIPLAAGIINAVRRKTFHKEDKEGFWLSLMLAGASVFGVVDHMWNGELFLIGPSLASDLALGTAITACVFAGWSIIVNKEVITQKLGFMNRKTGIYRQ